MTIPSYVRIIEKTRDRTPLTQTDIEAIVTGTTNNQLPDYQLAAWLMAVTCNGISDQEVFWLTGAMAISGQPAPPSLGVIDKHSTGGVGDKTTLLLAPIMASLQIPMAKMSGRGLGHTGGTLDKLESIPNFRVNLTASEMDHQLQTAGVAVVAQTEELAPADKRMYALRDVTGTVDSIPLIAASVMSKKLAAGAPNLLLDVKVGSGAFMKNIDQARSLARLMVDIGTFHGKNVRALLTNMDQPLGYGIGNAIEVNEVIDVLQGHGPKDLREEVLILASHMVSLVSEESTELTYGRVAQSLSSGQAYEAFMRWVSAQGAQVNALTQPLPLAPIHVIWRAANQMTVVAFDTQMIGEIALSLGAGRTKLGEAIDHAVGLKIYPKIGHVLNHGDTVAEVFARNRGDAAIALENLSRAVVTRTGQHKILDDKVLLDVVTPRL